MGLRAGVMDAPGSDLLFRALEERLRGLRAGDLYVGTWLRAQALVEAVQEGAMDLAVLPATDLPLDLPDTVAWVQVGPRLESGWAALTPAATPSPLAELPDGAPVGFLHPEAETLLRALHPALEPRALSRPPEPGQEDPVPWLAPAWCLPAVAGPGWSVELLDPGIWLPRPGEGATLVLYARGSGDLLPGLEPLLPGAAGAEVRAELACLEGVEPTPEIRVFARAIRFGTGLRMHARLMDRSGRRVVRAEGTGETETPEPLGWSVAAQLVERAEALLL